MNEPVFLRHSHGLTLAEIAALIGAPLPPAVAHDRRMVNVASLDRAAPGDLTFFDHRKHREAAVKSHAGACITTQALAEHLPPRLVALTTRDPYRAFVAVARAMFPHALRPSSLVKGGEIKAAHVDASARLENGVTIEPGAVIGPDVDIGSGTLIAANAVVGPGARIGRDCAIGAAASVTNCLIGDRVVIHAGCRIGQDGFGYVMTAKGHSKVPQIGRVIIQDDVEIGAGTTIDRGALRDTTIGEGTKIDNLVQIGHNVQVGRFCVLVAQTGISGSTTIGDYAMLGGQVGVGDHITIGEGAMLAGKSGVISDVPAGGRWGGYPARPRAEWLRGQAVMHKLARSGAEGKQTSGNDGEPR